MIAIEMVGAVYCPLSPRDPQNRLHSLVQQAQSPLVFIHHLTKPKFNDHAASIDIDSALIFHDFDYENGADLLTDVILTPDSIAYIIFTSGSTGAPKAVSHYLNEKHALYQYSFCIGSN